MLDILSLMRYSPVCCKIQKFRIGVGIDASRAIMIHHLHLLFRCAVYVDPLALPSARVSTNQGAQTQRVTVLK